MPDSNRFVILLVVAIVAIIVAGTQLDGIPMYATMAGIGVLFGLSLSPRFGRGLTRR